MNIPAQSQAWALGFGGLVALTLGCGVVALACQRGAIAGEPRIERVNVTSPGARRRLHWIALAAVPASLMLAVTTYLTTDVASVPLLWVVPLSIYLVTFILAFAARQVIPHRWVARAAPVMAVLLVPMLVLPVERPLAMGLVHLMAFGALALMCHGELARRRPEASHLTDFYLCVAIGGVLGGAFNTLVAPVVFDSVTEYPLILVLACALAPLLGSKSVGQRSHDFVVPGVAIAGIALVAADRLFGIGQTVLFVGFVWLSVFSLSLRSRPWRLALAMLAVLVTGSAAKFGGGTLLHEERTFFGVYRVSLDTAAGVRLLRHGTTLHGAQAVDSQLAHEPMTYFHRTGPAGDVIQTVLDDRPRAQVGVIGLGAGTLAAYARPSDAWTFYEIDPAVERIASNSAYFTYLRDCGSRCRIVVGDARLTLAQAEPAQFDLLVLDAFSSDSIPIHLLTAEALQLYSTSPSRRPCWRFTSRIAIWRWKAWCRKSPAASPSTPSSGSTATDRRRSKPAGNNRRSGSRWAGAETP